MTTQINLSWPTDFINKEGIFESLHPYLRDFDGGKTFQSLACDSRNDLLRQKLHAKICLLPTTRCDVEYQFGQQET
jgi:hypothetical protein